MPWKVSKTLLTTLRAKHGQHSVAVMAGGGYGNVKAVLPTGHTVLDHWVLGIGGLAYGHLTEIWGKEGSGKSTLLAQLMSMCQREKGAVLLRDAEQKMQEDWTQRFGLDLKGVLLVQEGTVETFVDTSITFMEEVGVKTPKLIALDSLAFLPSEEEWATDGEPPVGSSARAWAAKGKIFVECLAKSKTAFVFANQPRIVISSFGSYTSTPGGNSMKHGPLVRIKVHAGSKSRFKEDRGDGQYIEVTAVKNQLAPPHRSCKLKLRYNGTFDEKWSVVDHAKDMLCLEKDATRTQYKEALENLGWAHAIPWVESTDRETE